MLPVTKIGSMPPFPRGGPLHYSRRRDAKPNKQLSAYQEAFLTPGI